MLKILGRAVPISKAIAFVVVILIGIVSIFLTNNILHNSYNIQEESEHIAIIDNIHSDTYRLVLAIHHFLIEPDVMYSDEAIRLIRDIRKAVEKYRAEELTETYEEKNIEIDLLDVILTDIAGLEAAADLFENFSKTGKYDKDILMGLEDFAYELEETAEKINHVHFGKIKDWSDESLLIAWVILFLYIAFIIFGGFPFIWDMGFFHKKD